MLVLNVSSKALVKDGKYRIKRNKRDRHFLCIKMFKYSKKFPEFEKSHHICHLVGGRGVNGNAI